MIAAVTLRILREHWEMLPEWDVLNSANAAGFQAAEYFHAIG